VVAIATAVCREPTGKIVSCTFSSKSYKKAPYIPDLKERVLRRVLIKIHGRILLKERGGSDRRWSVVSGRLRYTDYRQPTLGEREMVETVRVVREVMGERGALILTAGADELIALWSVARLTLQCLHLHRFLHVIGRHLTTHCISKENESEEKGKKMKKRLKIGSRFAVRLGHIQEISVKRQYTSPSIFSK